MTEHTPGPWKESHDPSPDWTGDWYIYGGPHRNRFIVQGEGWNNEERANVRLIIAAPEMLEACRHAVEHHRPYVDESGVVCITLQSYAMIKRIVLGHAEEQA